MIEVKNGPERVLIVGVQTENYNDDKFMELMREMRALTETAQGVAVGEITQKMSRTDSRTAVGSGKLEEVKRYIEVEEIDLVIFFNKLTPSMNRVLEEELKIKVIDRVQLILDIFAMRAKSREGKLQVSLAQYEYLLPRISGQGIQMSRLGGGIGTRGPGETQLETDRRHIRSRISQVKKELVDVEAHRERTRIRRKSGREFNLGLVGYTNAGKTTLLSKLTDADAYIQDQLFATLDPLTRQMTINGQDIFTLTDTVGFIEELPTELVQAFKSTLEEIRYMDVLLHVVDASNPARDMHEGTVMRILRDLGLEYAPILTIYNKVDLADENFVPVMSPHVVISAKNDQDIEKLKDAIWDACLETTEEYAVIIQPEEADLLALYRQKTLVDSLEFDEDNQHYILRGYRRRLTDESS